MSCAFPAEGEKAVLTPQPAVPRAHPHLNESIQISFANEDFNGHRLTNETEGRQEGRYRNEVCS